MKKKKDEKQNLILLSRFEAGSALKESFYLIEDYKEEGEVILKVTGKGKGKVVNK